MKPLLAALAGILVTSWGSILVRLASVPAMGAAFHRMAFATIFLLPVLAMRRAMRTMRASRPKDRSSRPRFPALWTLASGVCLALHFATWIASLSYTSIGSSVVLVSTMPVFSVALSALFLKERAGAASVAAILVALSGAAVIGWGDYGAGGDSLGGDLLALAGAFFAAVYLLIGRKVRGQVPLLEYLVAVYGASAVVLLVLGLSAGAGLGPYPRASYLWLILMGLGPSVVGHSLLNHAVRHLRAYVVHTVGLVEPFLATLYAYIIFGERPGRHLYAGGALVVIGLNYVLLEERRRTGMSRDAALTARSA